MDSVEFKKVTAYLQVGNNFFNLLLWSGESYDAIGDWTQAEAYARIIELLS